jgi:hypothetical protein
LALIFSVPGFWLALLAFQDQRATNHSQIAANEREAQRYQRRFASRLAWIDTPGTSHGIVLQIQNRSPTVLGDVVLLSDSKRSAIFAGDIPPCSVLTVDLASIHPFDRDDHALWPPTLAIFQDPVGAWSKDLHEVRPLIDHDLKLLLALAHGLRNHAPVMVHFWGNGVIGNMPRFPTTAVAIRPADDCGEG